MDQGVQISILRFNDVHQVKEILNAGTRKVHWIQSRGCIPLLNDPVTQLAQASPILIQQQKVGAIGGTPQGKRLAQASRSTGD
jgi:hypothetical protein